MSSASMSVEDQDVLWFIYPENGMGDQTDICIKKTIDGGETWTEMWNANDSIYNYYESYIHASKILLMNLFPLFIKYR